MGVHIGPDIVGYLKKMSVEFEGHKLWKGYKTWDEYGMVLYKEKRVLVHRLSAHLFLGFDLKSSKLICHIRECMHRNCWEPTHLYIGDERSNAKDRRATTGYSMNCNQHSKRGSQDG